MDEVKCSQECSHCSVYFYPKKIGVSWLCTSNFGNGMYIFVQVQFPLFVVCQSFFFMSLMSCTLASSPAEFATGYIIGSCLAVNGLVDPPNGHVVHDSGADDSSETWA